jgi:hypothetical protein
MSELGGLRQGILDTPQTINQAASPGLHGDFSMMETTYTVYSGDHFENCDRYYAHEFKELWESGAIVERKMPYPNKRHPERTKTVYFWKGIADLTCQMHDLSAEMPPIVTELAAQGSRMHKAFAFSYRGIMMGNASRPVMVPA